MNRFAAHVDFTTGSLRLMVHYAHYLICRRNPPVAANEVLDKRVDILRKTTLYDGRHPCIDLNPPIAEWNTLKEQLIERIRARAAEGATADLEDECWTLLRPHVESAFSARYEDYRGNAHSPYNCWSYDFNSGAAERPDGIQLHFTNAFQPESPFSAANHPRIVSDLLQLLADATAAYPTATVFRCSSWLNKFPPFTSLFPPSWATSYSAGEYSVGTYGHWGQYMDHRGTFHQCNADALRSTGSHPYTSGFCQCPIDEAVRYLKNQTI